MDLHSIRLSTFLTALGVLALPTPALAYIGPGTGLGAVAVTLAIVFGALLLLVGLVWYPLKRLMKTKMHVASESTKANDLE